MQLYEWEYSHLINSDRGWRSIKVTSPLTWVLTYSSNYSLHMFRQVLAGKGGARRRSRSRLRLARLPAHLHFTKFPAIAESAGWFTL